MNYRGLKAMKTKQIVDIDIQKTGNTILITIEGIQIERVQSCRFLSNIIDSWNNCIQEMWSWLYFLRKYRYFDV